MKRTLVLMLLVGCSSVSVHDGARTLSSPGWAPGNRQRIEAFLRENGSPGSNAGKPPCAAFDWDMTSIFNDLGDATFYYQLDTLSLELTPEEMARILPEKLVSTGTSLAAERTETLDAYSALAKAGLTGFARPWAEKRAVLEKDPELARAHAIFRYRINWFYERLEEVDGAPVAYPWIVKLYAGFTPETMRRLVERVLEKELREKGEKCTQAKIEHPDPAKNSPFTIARGVVASPEMKELYAALRENGFDVYVVTASFRWTIVPLAERYGVPEDHVVGIRLALRDGKFTDEVLLPITYRQGKADNIRQFLPREPIFSAGDSDTDVEMLSMPSVKLRLIMDRKKSPTSDIGKLYEKARRTDPEHWLIQGRNDYGPDGTALGTWNGTTRTP